MKLHFALGSVIFSKTDSEVSEASVARTSVYYIVALLGPYVLIVLNLKIIRSRVAYDFGTYLIR
jgi:hypothetical protein